MQTNGKLDVRKMTLMAMICAVAITAVALIRVPIVAFLYYEPKDVAIAIGGFLLGPFAALLMSIVVSFVEMLTISADGFYGLLMNIISTSTFVCTAAFIYKKKRTMAGALIGLIAGIAVNVPVMLLWNYLVVPLYLGAPREVVAGMLVPIFLPFNLVKGVLNAAFIILLYRPLSAALKKARMLPATAKAEPTAKKINIGVTIISLFAILTSVLFVFALRSDNGGNAETNYENYEVEATNDGYDSEYED